MAWKPCGRPSEEELQAASDDGPVKVWPLAPLLIAMLDAFFQAGRVPTSALVTPIHKKGNDLDTGNYMPIAVGEPLYRLYTITLIKRLVGWSEQHDLRSPA